MSSIHKAQENPLPEAEPIFRIGETLTVEDCTMLDRRTTANRQNARLAGVKTKEGKRISRFNARKHGILASVLGPWDLEELKPILLPLMEELAPATPLEEAIVEKLAFALLRLQRCARAEALYHQATWMAVPRWHDPGPLGIASYFKPSHFEKIATLINRYDASLTSQFLRLLHELERLQRMRAGQKVPAPIVADVNVSDA